MVNKDRLDNLLLQWETAREAGLALTVEELCADCREAIPDLRRRVDLLERLAPVLDLESPPPPLLPQPAPPDLPGYEIEGELGRGGMGVVYLARDLRLPRRVAIKVLAPRFGLTEAARRRFVREAEVLARLEHEHIVPIHQAELCGGRPYFVMGHVAGGSLDRRMEHYRADPRAAAALVEQVARAVHHAHQRGVLHRDLKPGNILLRRKSSTSGTTSVAQSGFRPEDFEPLVGDFGVAQLSDQVEAKGDPPAAPADGPLTGAGTAIGTPRYMAPEQRDPGRVPLTPATDVWALGVILHELLTGARPFSGLTHDSEAVTSRSAVPTPEVVLAASLPAGLAPILRRCLHPDPGERYPTTQDLANDLSRWRRAAPLRRRLLLAAAAVVLLLLPAALTLRDRGGQSPSPTASVPAAERDYVEAARERRTRLEKGQGVDLITPLTRELPAAWRAGGGDVTFPAEGDGGSVLVTAAAPSLLELLPDPGVEDFRLTVEMRQDFSYSPWGCVGLYVGHQKYMTGMNPQHFFVRMSFGDLGVWGDQYKDEQGAPAGMMHLDVSHFSGAPGKALAPGLQQNHGVRYPASDRGNAPGPWHTITIDVHPRTMTLRAVGKTAELDPAKAWEAYLPHLVDWNRELQGLAVELPPRGGVGIWITLGKLSIRSLRIEPLPGKR